MPQGPNMLAQSGTPLFFELVNAADVGIAPPETRIGDSLRTWVRSLSVFQKEALVASSRTGKVWRLASDEGPYLDGHDAAPCPLAFLSVGMVASYMNEITALAKQQGVEIRKLKLTQDNYYTMTGSMPKRTMVGGALPVELQVEIDCDLGDAALNQFLMNAVHASPLNGLMRGHLESLFALSKNGVELAPAKALRVDGPIYPDPGDHFAKAQPVADPANERLCWPQGVTPKKPVTGGTATAGSSLAAEQNRTLNIGATCTLREDGMKEILQLQYSPHGTSFNFLSEEATENGGLGRAPDANSYISAGIGFCFMTQFGRFVKMLNLDLSDYRIVQDSHFSLGGASGGTGEAGRADPLETHVYLETGESDETAREMLDISEQTCFLHAFCKTDLKTKLRVHRL
ncbi:OsmC family protein [Antarctobacter sp.]|uniref:OsmC family protein n=1 Tax=Antarctobacter sp. TaxID=1872577 RepID=UPI002B2664C6|nr:OsmC family protein [Antarctobacter sp.]